MADGDDPIRSARASESGGVILGTDAKAAIAEQAVAIGMICGSCALPIEGPGFEFVSIRAETREGRPTIVNGRQFICGREECAEAREEARSRCTAVRPAGGWTVFYGGPGEQEEAPGE